VKCECQRAPSSYSDEPRTHGGTVGLDPNEMTALQEQGTTSGVKRPQPAGEPVESPTASLDTHRINAHHGAKPMLSRTSYPYAAAAPRPATRPRCGQIRRHLQLAALGGCWRWCRFPFALAMAGRSETPGAERERMLRHPVERGRTANARRIAGKPCTTGVVQELTAAEYAMERGAIGAARRGNNVRADLHHRQRGLRVTRIGRCGRGWSGNLSAQTSTRRGLGSALAGLAGQFGAQGTSRREASTPRAPDGLRSPAASALRAPPPRK